MEKKVLLKELVDTGTSIRRLITPKAKISDKGNRPAGEFWDANTIMTAIVAVINGYIEGGMLITEIPNDSVGTRLIIDGSVNVEDLSTDIQNKITTIVDEEDENVTFGI